MPWEEQELLRLCVDHCLLGFRYQYRSERQREPAQSVQPWQFGHGETKRTCFWLKGLPPLVPTNIVEGREARVHRMPPSPDRWKERSRSYPGIAAAFAEQWGLADLL